MVTSTIGTAPTIASAMELVRNVERAANGHGSHRDPEQLGQRNRDAGKPRFLQHLRHERIPVDHNPEQ